MNVSTDRARASIFVQKKDYWLKFFHSIADNKHVQKEVFQKYLTQEKISVIKSKIQEQFEELLPQLPDFGYKKINQFSIDMIKNALSIAFYRVLKEEGFQVRLIGQVLNEMAEVYYANLNPLMKYLIRRPYLSSSFQKKAKSLLDKRKGTEDPEDYHCTFVEGDKKNLLFGMDYTNCAGLHLLKRYNALEIAPYLCLCDYPMHRGINIGFNREQNLAIGGKKCAFRFYRNYPTPKGWPPEDVPEYKNYKFTE